MSFNTGEFEYSGPPPGNSSSLWLKLLLIIFVIFICVIGFIGYQIFSFLDTPGSTPGKEIEIAIPPGTKFHVLSLYLQDIGAITDVNKFEILAKWKGMSDKVKSGRFLINTGWTPQALLDYLVTGSPLLNRITIPEGLPWWEVGKRLEKAGFVRFEDFKTVIHDPEFLRYWGIPFHNAEGFLFPDTYLLARPFKQNVESAKIIVGRLIDTFWRKTAPLWPNGMRPSFRNASVIKQPLILASIIEKETHFPGERRKVSGVYTNRLAVGMPLYADPTVIYGLGENFDGKLRRSQLQDKNNPYNTYVNKGLPPGPIASPGLDSIRAALNPEEHNYYYFVARGDGSHVFSTNLDSHNRMVKIYQLPLRKGDTGSLIHGGVAPSKVQEDLLPLKETVPPS
ncbi:endolytic transglycosylase MltG [Lawsonia intracellularis]|uniref:Endolytic murein transglycosylase n=1 Tax=Lawsonia intracellularis (strain PHE/MN1-00) TaxID=363253 RepID=Q1MR20_LAWIP|nr:endolytic transglycosylase MltG [Lawsonia intracellularis]AGC49915.1 YceG-like family protein [Lawsonia intracellularis N343]KAA0205414.1 endolytic transglycosylase MltG [Lawsonia intracellularis]MBZ3892047.1 endolytic transglycosylase MltG [Lawsonia intracellularis]OMQ04677.1 aminodeoxychorismate lyase [Lawsonia intracellularis]RBN32037.1 endolytic transglycosylase MltG [Lawsonia intracellularis]